MPLARQLNRAWRIFGTGFSFVLFGLGAFAFAIVLTLMLYLLPVGRGAKQRWARKVVSSASFAYVRLMRALGLLSYSFELQRLNSGGGQLVIANHPTLLDAIFLFCIFPNASCIVKAAIAHAPFTMGLVRLAGYIPNSEDREYLLARAAESIKRGDTLIIFPEGTRSDDVHNIKLKRGASHVALKANCVVQPLFIECKPLTLRKHQPWYAIPETPPHFSITALDCVAASACVDAAKSESIQARQLTRYWQDLFDRELRATV